MTTPDGTMHARMRAAAPEPGPPPDVTALWRQARRGRRQRVTAAVAGTTALFGLAAVVGAAALRPSVEFAPGAEGSEPQATGGPDETYCAAAEPFLGEVLDLPSGGGDGPEGMTPGDYEASHAQMTAQFAGAAAASPPELADHWAALEADLAAQGEVWESIDWDPDTVGWPALVYQWAALPTSAAGSAAMEAVTEDFSTRCVED